MWVKSGETVSEMSSRLSPISVSLSSAKLQLRNLHSLSLRPAATLGFRARRDCAQLCQIVCNILCITPLSSLIFACKAESQHKFGLIFLVSESKHVGQVKSPPKIDTCQKVDTWNMAKNSVSLQKCVCTKMVASFVSSDRSS